MARTGGIETVNIEAPAPGGAVPRLMRGRDRAAMARRLRRDGWSYRRISDAIGLPYNEVSRLLDNDVALSCDPIRLPPLATASARPAAAPESGLPPAMAPPSPPPLAVAAPRLPVSNGTNGAAAAANTKVLLQKVDSLTRTADEHRKALEQLSRDVAEVKAEQRALSRRLQELFTALWQRLLEVGRRTAASDEAKP